MSSDTIKLTIELELPADLARDLERVSHNMEGGRNKILEHALKFYLLLAQFVWPTDSFWIMRGNDYVRLFGPQFPASPDKKGYAEALKKTKQTEVKLPHNWTVYDGDKDDDKE